MSVAAVISPAEYESLLQRYLFERAEESRAVRVGEKEVSERAEIVARYAELFTRDQLEALRQAESEAAAGEERERLYRLRKTCEAGLISAELAEREAAAEVYTRLKDRWLERLLGPEREDVPSSSHVAYLRRLSPLEAIYTKEQAVPTCMDTLSRLGFDLESEP